jgi:hypothetical protein
VVGLAIVPLTLGIAPALLPEWMAAMAGGVVGLLMGRRTVATR